jgi:hypothetical protein
MEFIIIITILAVFGLVTRGIRLEEPNLAKYGSMEIEAGEFERLLVETICDLTIWSELAESYHGVKQTGVVDA